MFNQILLPPNLNGYQTGRFTCDLWGKLPHCQTGIDRPKSAAFNSRLFPNALTLPMSSSSLFVSHLLPHRTTHLFTAHLGADCGPDNLPGSGDSASTVAQSEPCMEKYMPSSRVTCS